MSGKKWWYARFWDEDTNRYIKYRPLNIPYEGRRGGRDLAMKKAEEILPDVMKARDPLVLTFVSEFWSDDSRYLREKRISDKKPLSIEYVGNNQRVLRLHVATCPALAGVTLSQLRAGHINDWKLWALEKGTGARTVNYALQAIRVAVRHSVERGDLPSDPLRPVKKAMETPSEAGVLMPSEVEAILRVQENDPRVKAAVLLAALAGLRRGEVRGLRWGDIDREEGCLHIVHNYINEEGAKGCKSGSSRDTILLDELLEALDEVKAIAPSTGRDDFVLFDINSHTRPISEQILKLGFNRVLKNIGIDETKRKARQLRFHGLRHSFVTIARMKGINDSVIQALVGHRSPVMMARYSHVGKVIDFKAAKVALRAVPKVETQSAAMES
ncbi:MAG: site-specific integrase [Spirochaetota bacterium]